MKKKALTEAGTVTPNSQQHTTHEKSSSYDAAVRRL
jgi:hypothetical protein